MQTAHRGRSLRRTTSSSCSSLGGFLFVLAGLDVCSEPSVEIKNKGKKNSFVADSC